MKKKRKNKIPKHPRGKLDPLLNQVSSWLNTIFPGIPKETCKKIVGGFTIIVIFLVIIGVAYLIS